MLFVFDTNTLVSAIIKPESLPMQALTAAQHRGKLIFSDETREELLQVLAREKFNKYLPFDLRLEAALSILDRAQLRQISQFTKIECRDPNDIRFLRIALEAEVSCLISGDIHLKELNPSIIFLFLVLRLFGMDFKTNK